MSEPSIYSKRFVIARVNSIRLWSDLAHANRQLALAKREPCRDATRVAEDAQRAKSAFVSKVSHEFRTPLKYDHRTDRSGDGESFRVRDADPEGLLQDLGIVHRNCTHLATLVNDVLDLSQVEVGRGTLSRGV